MNTVIRSLILSIFAVGLAVHAVATDDMQIYSDRLKNMSESN
jgi:hypothetical protein